MIHRARSLVTVLALALPAAAHADPLATFMRQDKYTYCDVKALSALWKKSVADSKVIVGKKIEARAESFVDDQLGPARQAAANNAQARCSFGEAGFTYDDAKKLGALWKVDTGKAKAKAEIKINAGGEKSLRSMLKSSPTTIAQGDASQGMGAFLEQDTFGMCEVKLLSALWKTTAKDAKARIGMKVASGNQSYVNGELKTARENKKLKCTAADAGFTAYDVKRMKDLWQLTIADIERKITNGSSATLRGMLHDQALPDADLTAFTNQHKYTMCDAVMLSKLWKRSTADAKAFIGAKLTAKQKKPVDVAIADARKNAVKNPTGRCGYYDAGLSWDDLVVLAALWKKPENEMKAEVALRLAKGQEATIKAQLKKANANKPKPAPTPVPQPPAADPMKTKAPAPAPTPTKAPAAPTKAT